MKNYLFGILAIFIFAGCASTHVPIDQVPMYGGMDRTAHEDLRKGDKEFIEQAVVTFGSRRNASKAFADKAFRDYASGDSRNGIRRFNQAWLLDERNPESYWGFGLWYRHLGDDESARQMMNKAHAMGLREEEFLKTYNEITTK